MFNQQLHVIFSYEKYNNFVCTLLEATHYIRKFHFSVHHHVTWSCNLELHNKTRRNDVYYYTPLIVNTAIPHVIKLPQCCKSFFQVLSDVQKKLSAKNILFYFLHHNVER